ncbi:coiled-coil domain-containing protein 125-like isoform X2 [Limulus polyphemus]|uniref:Coiled-coil domain-containing protein 125-like isoform X2 n=1 Tax=Limulus polyphemus TaxID=6850 RepID=A0ABM1T4X3_LIMPO|nr:coiled-coil domain-containing protein 125-like isoform X2 [Limulus polyphemus]
MEVEIEEELSPDGDLGLGLGLKPGGIPYFCVDCDCSKDAKNEMQKGSGLPHFAYKCHTKNCFLNTKYRGNGTGRQTPRKVIYSSENRLYSSYLNLINKSWIQLCKRKFSSSNNLEVGKKKEEGEITRETLSVQLEEQNPLVIRIGTSLRKQREIFYSDLQAVIEKYGAKEIDLDYEKKYSPCRCDNIEEKLFVLHEELNEMYERNDQLKGELDIYEKLLYGKYKASEVLLQQLNIAENEKDEVVKMGREVSSELQQEVNSLQFELQCTEGQLSDIQQQWLDRYNSVCRENDELKATVRDQAMKLKKITLENQGLKRECDEMLAMLDVRERNYYKRSLSISSDDSFSEASSFQLGVLGACVCRGSKQEPCGCAKAACLKQHTIAELLLEVEGLQSRLEEAQQVIDVYREAFEEQLKKNQSMTRKLNELKPESEEQYKGSLKNGILKQKPKEGRKRQEVVKDLVEMSAFYC